jgi:hypothetical protein
MKNLLRVRCGTSVIFASQSCYLKIVEETTLRHGNAEFTECLRKFAQSAGNPTSRPLRYLRDLCVPTYVQP